MRLRLPGRAVGAIAFMVTLSLSAVPAAQASFHYMKIREVYPGTTATPNSEFVELQMYAAGQSFIGGHKVFFYDATGNPSGSATCPHDVAHGESQRSVLIATPGAETQFGVTADCPLPVGDHLPIDSATDGSGGSVCWENVDCMSYGTTGTDALPVGEPVASGGWQSGNSAVRSIAHGCKTLLEPVDDTNDSNDDFVVSGTQTPRNNAVTPTEHACGGGADNTAPTTGIDKGPKKKVKTTKKRKKVKFLFSSDDPNATFECSLDEADFESCTSPEKIKVKTKRKAEKHSFAVRATDVAGNVDQTPDELKFKLKRKK
jgi:hypothetical protein